MAKVNRKRLREIRKSRGYTQEYVARMSDISLRRYSDLENKLDTNPQLETLSAIANALGVDVAEILLN